MRCVRYDILVVTLRFSHVFGVFAPGNEIAYASKLAKLATKKRKYEHLCDSDSCTLSDFWEFVYFVMEPVKEFSRSHSVLRGI